MVLSPRKLKHPCLMHKGLVECCCLVCLNSLLVCCMASSHPEPICKDPAAILQRLLFPRHSKGLDGTSSAILTLAFPLREYISNRLRSRGEERGSGKGLPRGLQGEEIAQCHTEWRGSIHQLPFLCLAVSPDSASPPECWLGFKSAQRKCYSNKSHLPLFRSCFPALPFFSPKFMNENR